MLPQRNDASRRWRLGGIVKPHLWEVGVAGRDECQSPHRSVQAKRRWYSLNAEGSCLVLTWVCLAAHERGVNVTLERIKRVLESEESTLN